MAQEDRVGDLVVRLLDGRSQQRVLALEAGQAQRPFAVGRQSNWTVDAARVAAAHVILAFNGYELYVCAVRGERALLDGKPLGRRWTVAAVPCELRFGSARIVVRTRAGDEETVSPLTASIKPSRGLEEHTTIDEIRLAEALRLSMEDAGVPATAEVDVPIAQPRRSSPISTPTLPLRRPFIRPIVIPVAHLLQGLESRSG